MSSNNSSNGSGYGIFTSLLLGVIFMSILLSLNHSDACKHSLNDMIPSEPYICTECGEAVKVCPDCSNVHLNTDKECPNCASAISPEELQSKIDLFKKITKWSSVALITIGVIFIIINFIEKNVRFYPPDNRSKFFISFLSLVMGILMSVCNLYADKIVSFFFRT